MSSPPSSAPDQHPLAPSTPERDTSELLSVVRAEHRSPCGNGDGLPSSLASLTLEEASTSSSLVTLVSADGHRLTVRRRVAEESGTIRQLLLSRGEGSMRRRERESARKCFECPSDPFLL